MNQTEVNRFNEFYQRHLRLLKLQGKSQKTIDAYSRSVRRVGDQFDCCPDQLTPDQLEIYFTGLVESHSWSTVKIDRNGLQSFLEACSQEGLGMAQSLYDSGYPYAC